MDEEKVEELITSKTKVIVPVHYAGVACDMDKIMSLANKYNLFVIEDAAQAIDNYYVDSKGDRRALGAIGHLAAFSFHETKNIISGEGGMLVINDSQFNNRAEIIWEKGTNRSAFFKGEVDKYGWVDIGSSFLPSEIIAAFLWAQLENLDLIQAKRKQLWSYYYENLNEWAEKNDIRLPIIPEYSSNNAHIFYLICKNEDQRNNLISYLKDNRIHSVFHYLSLHKSDFYGEAFNRNELLYSDSYSNCLLRLPLYFELDQIEYVVKVITKFNLNDK